MSAMDFGVVVLKEETSLEIEEVMIKDEFIEEMDASQYLSQELEDVLVSSPVPSPMALMVTSGPSSAQVSNKAMDVSTGVRGRATSEQFTAMVHFMERYGDISRPCSLNVPHARQKAEKLWHKLAEVLNAIPGGVQRSADKWKKVWVDWKSKTKKKHTSGLYSSPRSRRALTPVEKRIIAVIKSAVKLGEPELEVNRSHGSLDPSQIQDCESNLNREDHMTTTESPVPPLVPDPRRSPTPIPQTPILETILSYPSTHTSQTDTIDDVKVKQSLSSLNPPSTTPLSSSPPRLKRTINKVRRNRGMTPFDRATSEWVAIEHKRLELEEARDRRHHEVEMERLRVSEQQTRMLESLCSMARNMMEMVAATQARCNCLQTKDSNNKR